MPNQKSPRQKRQLLATLIAKLERFVRLSQEDLAAIDRLRDGHLATAHPDEPLVCEGERPKFVRLMISGWACRFKDLANGRRQIVAFFLPGDFCDLNVYILRAMDHSIGAITSVEYLELPAETIYELTREHPRVAQALLWHELVSTSIQREWLLNLGQRTAIERMGHLIVELFIRLKSVGLTEGKEMRFPLTQSELADATGISPVHVNRTLQELRRDGLITLEQKRLRILDFDRLRGLAMFDSAYLHLEREGRYLDAND